MCKFPSFELDNSSVKVVHDSMIANVIGDLFDKDNNSDVHNDMQIGRIRSAYSVFISENFNTVYDKIKTEQGFVKRGQVVQQIAMMWREQQNSN